MKLSKSALNQLIADNVRALNAYFSRRNVAHSDIDDLIVEAVSAVWRKWPEALASGMLEQYQLYSTAHGVLANYRRGLGRRQELMRQLELHQHTLPSAADPVDHLDESDLAIALSGLAEVDRELVLLVALEGMPVAEAGAIIGLSAQNARAHYSRARAKLRAAIEKVQLAQKVE